MVKGKSEQGLDIRCNHCWGRGLTGVHLAAAVAAATAAAATVAAQHTQLMTTLPDRLTVGGVGQSPAQSPAPSQPVPTPSASQGVDGPTVETWEQAPPTLRDNHHETAASALQPDGLTPCSGCWQRQEGGRPQASGVMGLPVPYRPERWWPPNQHCGGSHETSRAWRTKGIGAEMQRSQTHQPNTTEPSYWTTSGQGQNLQWQRGLVRVYLAIWAAGSQQWVGRPTETGLAPWVLVGCRCQLR